MQKFVWGSCSSERHISSNLFKTKLFCQNRKHHIAALNKHRSWSWSTDLQLKNHWKNFAIACLIFLCTVTKHPLIQLQVEYNYHVMWIEAGRKVFSSRWDHDIDCDDVVSLHMHVRNDARLLAPATPSTHKELFYKYIKFVWSGQWEAKIIILCTWRENNILLAWYFATCRFYIYACLSVYVLLNMAQLSTGHSLELASCSLFWLLMLISGANKFQNCELYFFSFVGFKSMQQLDYETKIFVFLFCVNNELSYQVFEILYIHYIYFACLGCRVKRKNIAKFGGCQALDVTFSIAINPK